MANRYVWSGGSNTAPYDTWAKAAPALLTATAAAGAGDTIYAHAETEVIAADTTYTLAAGVKIIGSNDTANAPPLTEGTRIIDGSGTSGVDITINGVGALFNLHFKAGGSTGAGSILISQTDPSEIEFENCTFQLPNTSTNSNVSIGIAPNPEAVRTRNCSFIWGSTGQGISLEGYWESINDDFVAGATVPTTLFEFVSGNGPFFGYGGDFSDVSGTLFEAAPDGYLYAVLNNCSLHASVTVFPPTTAAKGEVYVFDSASGDTHYHLRHYTWLGSTVISTSIYANNGGASYDGTNQHSWVIASTANASLATPYRSPWIPVYHSGTAAITPSIEILRNGSATAYTDEQVWGEWMVKTTSGSTRASYFNDRRGILAAAANQATGALGASDWTGEGGTAWFGKLTPTSTVTPAEIGHIMSRIVVGGVSLTVYADPQNRTLT